MFLRVKRGGSERHPHDYLQIVESYREGGRPKQRVLFTLGRLDQLRDSGQLDRLTEGLARFSETLRVLDAARAPDVASCRSRSWGPALVFGRLWREQGLPAILSRLSEDRRFGFDVERVAFTLALQRLCAPGSDRLGAAWLRTIEAPGADAIELQHLYRTVAWLAEVREPLERELFARDRDLFSQELDLVFIDTTSLAIYRDEETALRRRGYSRDRRPELPQVVLCVAVDRHGWPVAWEILPGNTDDRTALRKVVAELRRRMRIGRVVVVADRGMVSAAVIEELTGDAEAPFDYIFGCRMRRQKEVSDEVLARAGRYRQVAGNLEVKEVRVEQRRYVVCRNPEEAARDRMAREALVAKLEATLAHQGPKAVVGNRGFARFLRLRKEAVEIDHQAIEADARLDGKFVLRTNTELPTEEVAAAYKSLWRVERTFREEKSTLEVRPIYHQRDDTTVGHIVASFLALRLEVDLQRRLDEKGQATSWGELMLDLAQVQAVDLVLDGKPWRLRTDLQGSAHAAFAAARVRPPPRVSALEQEAAA